MNEQSEYTDGNDEPLYNIGAVSRMVDVAETTLRVWERRYDFPNSSRTDGGHRLYSQNEVSRLHWVKSKIDDGMQVSQAIKALHHAENEGYFLGSLSSVNISSSANSEDFTAFNERLLSALLEHNTALCDRIIAEALTIYSLEHLILQIISPVMSQIGTMWENDEVDVATEHATTNFLRHRLLQWIRTSPPAYKVKPVILACAPGELHEGGLLMLGVLLSRLRWPVIYLGQSIVLEGFHQFVEQTEPSLVVFVAMTQESALTLSDWPRWLPNIHQSQQPMICFGGRLFVEQPDYVDRIDGIFLGKSLEDGVETLNQLLIDMYPRAR